MIIGGGHMQDNKDFDESKLEAAEIKLTSSSPMASKLSNFWYYHKWKVIIGAFILVLVVVCIIQFATKEDADAAVVIAVPEILEAEQVEAIDRVLTSFLSSDVNGDGKKYIDVYNYSVYTEEEMEMANTSETDADGSYVTKVARQYATDQAKQYTSFLQTGSSSVVIVSEDLYAKLKSSETVRTLNSVFGEDLPKGAMEDGYGVRLGDTYLYEYFPELQVLPADSIVCLLKPYLVGESSKEKFYKEYQQLFVNIVTFGAE